MKKTITMPQLVELITVATNSSYSSAQKFVTELFAIVGDELANGGSVKIKNLGVFSVGGIDGKTISFMPDKELADAINQPFAFFEAVELDDNVSEEDLAAVQNAPETKPVETPPVEAAEELPDAAPIQEQEEALTEDEADINIPIEETSKEEPATEEIEEETPAEELEGPATIEEEIGSQLEEVAMEVNCAEADDSFEPDQDEPNETEDTDEPTQQKAQQPAVQSTKRVTQESVVYVKQGPNPWMMLAIGLLIGIIVGYMLPIIKDVIYSTMPTKTETTIPAQTTIQKTEQEKPDTMPQTDTTITTTTTSPAINVETSTSAKPKDPSKLPPIATDIVAKKYYLTTMARKYYGSHHFWVYIYMENAAKLDHPDRVRPGTTVVIPAPEKYGINAKDPESVKKAKKKAFEIYAAHKNS